MRSGTKLVTAWMVVVMMTGAVCIIAPAAYAGVIRPVGIEAFSDQSIFESFEGLTPGENIEVMTLPDGTPYGGFLQLNLGPENPFTYQSGITMFSPVHTTRLRIGDFRLGNAAYSFHYNTGVRAAEDVPFGTAYIADNAGEFMFSFPAPMHRVGFHYLMGVARLEVFDGSGESLGIMDSPRAELEDFALATGSVFMGIESDVPIDSITIRNPSHGRCGLCQAIAIDGLIADPVPEPGTVGILAIFACGILARRQR